jgi:hypothetical protein
MGPVMANCVRRSNALLGYSSSLTYSECKLVPADGSLWSRVKEISVSLLVCVCVCVCVYTCVCVCMCVCL